VRAQFSVSSADRAAARWLRGRLPGSTFAVDRDLISLPLRLGFKATTSAARLAWGAAEQLAGLLSSRGEPESSARAPRKADAAPRIVDAREQAAARTAAPVESQPPEPVLRSLPSVAREPGPEPGPAHVEAAVELVAEVADPGAEEGAGPEIEVAAPWDGYDRLTAADVADRVAAASPAELGVVALYERANRRRQTVLRAVERRLAETT
jgi:hypothetical protein